MIGKAITYLANWYVVVNNKIAIATHAGDWRADDAPGQIPGWSGTDCA